jgi:gliding motility-associated-like protein
MPFRPKMVKFISCCLLLLTANTARAQIVANFTHNSNDNTQDCPPFVVHFNNTSTNATSYNWTVKLGASIVASSILSNPSFSFTIPGSYDISLTAISASGSNTITKAAYVIAYDTPAVSFTATPTTICAGQTVTFTNTTTLNGNPGTYRWIWGDNTPDGNASTTTTTHQYNSAVGSPFTVTLVATNSHGCQKSRSVVNYITVNPKPTMNMSASQNDFCTAPTGNITLTGSAAGVLPFTYSWWASDGWTATGQTATHSFAGPAGNSYAVRLAVTDGNGCKDTLLNPNYINIYNVKANYTGLSGACIGAPVTFTNTSTPAGGNSLWDLGNASGITAPSPSNVYYASGTYAVKLKYTVAACSDSITKNFTVYPHQNLGFTKVPDTPCPAPIAIQFNPTPTGLSYAWDFGDPTSGSANNSTASNPVHTYQADGFYDVTLISTDGNGCKDTLVKPQGVKIFNLLTTILPDKSGGCIPLTVTFSYDYLTLTPVPPLHAYPYPIKSYSWNFGDPASGANNTSTLAHPSHVYTTVGVYNVSLTITSVNNCVKTVTTTIKAGTKPIASFVGPDTICHGTGGAFISTSPTPPVNFYIWWGGNPIPEKGVNADIYNRKFYVGIDTIYLQTFYNGCPSDTAKKVLFVNGPDAEATYAYKCQKDSLLYVKFTDKSVDATSVIWYFGDGDTSHQHNPLHKYPAYNTKYAVMLAAFNNITVCTDTLYVDSVMPINTIRDLLVKDTTICMGDTLAFKSTMTGSFTNRIRWFIDFGSGPVEQFPGTPLDSFLAADSFIRVFDTRGNYGVIVLDSDEHSCGDMVRRNIYVSRPFPGFIASPTSGCTPFSVTFTDQSAAYTGSTIVNRFWDFGNGIQNNPVTNPFIHPYANPGSYDVRLVITDNIGCRDSSWLFAYIQGHHPQPAFVSADTGCIGVPINFTNNSTLTDTSIWSFGDNTANLYNVTTPSHTYAQLGTYNVKLIVKDIFGCKDSLTKNAKVTIVKPAAKFSVAPDSISACIPFNASFDASLSFSGIASYTWDFGDGSPPVTLAMPTATHTFLFPNYYTVTLTVTNTWGCSDSIKKHINVLGYAGSGTYHPLIGCVPLTDTFFLHNLNNIPSVIWDFNDGNTQAITNNIPVTHTYTVPGSYLPKLILADVLNCKTTSPGADTIRVDIAHANFRWGPACEFSDIEFFDSSKGLFSGIGGWLWTFDNNQTSAQKNPLHHYGPKGTYNVSLSVTSLNGCMDTIVKTVNVNALPVISAGGDTIICLHDSATLYPSGGVSYVWSPANYLSCVNCTNPLAGPPTKYRYYIVGTDANGCKNTDTVEINIKTKVTAITGKGGEICDLDSFHLHVSGAHHYVWTPSDGLDNSQSANPIAVPHQTTVYTVVSYEGRCIPDTDLVELIIHPLPTVKARGEQTIIAGNTADVQASGDRILKFAWSPSESVECPDCPFTTVKPTKTTTYTVHVYTDFGCVDSDKVTIAVLCDKSQLFIPNTFTPNGDGQNDVFYPRGTGLDKVQSFRIYNRWGEVVFERAAFGLNDKTYGWDGTFKGEKLPPDVFVYVIEALCDDGKIMTIKGDVTIVH